MTKMYGEQGVVFVAAAGSEMTNIDDVNNRTYTACYELNSLISFAASDENNDLSHFSNYGWNYVDITALGKDFYSSHPTVSNITLRNDYFSAENYTVLNDTTHTGCRNQPWQLC